MRLLFDQNLSPILADRLSDLFPDSTHLRSLHGQRASDARVWEMARQQQYVMVTKDGDFSDRSTIHGFPPKVIWFKRGNCSTAAVEAVLRHRCAEILHFGEDPDTGLLVIE